MLSEAMSHNHENIHLPLPSYGNLIEAIRCWPYTH